MSRSVLHAPAASYTPIAASPTASPKPVHKNPQWTDFDSKMPTPRTRGGKNRVGKQSIRARKNTKLLVDDGMLNLIFSGEDPGIAMDLRSHSLPPGPYRLSFELKGGSVGGGELFFTTNKTEVLPKGKRISFRVAANGNWQMLDLDLKTDKSIQQLRLDVSEGTGAASIRHLRLSDSSGKTLIQWPK